MNRCSVCAPAGITLCLHLVALEAREAAHPLQSDRRQALAAVVPLKPDDHHREYESVVRIEDRNEAERPPADMPPGRSNTLDEAVRIARQNFQAQWRRPASMIFSMAQDETLPPGKSAQ